MYINDVERLLRYQKYITDKLCGAFTPLDRAKHTLRGLGVVVSEKAWEHLLKTDENWEDIIDNLFWHDCFACCRISDIWWHSDGQKGAIITDFWGKESKAPTEGLKGRLNQVVKILAHGASGDTIPNEETKSKLEAEAVRLRLEIYKRTGDESVL